GSYPFIPREEFQAFKEEGLMAEYIEFAGNFYGMTKQQIDKGLIRSDIGIVVEPHGYDQLSDMYPGRVHTVYLTPPPWDEIEKRILLRDPSMTKADLQCRWDADYEIRAFEPEADYVLPSAPIQDWVYEVTRLVITSRELIHDQATYRGI